VVDVADGASVLEHRCRRGIVIGAWVLISGDRSGHHGIRLLGALIMAGGCLCAVVRLARDSH
jgi:hypothetical protein